MVQIHSKDCEDFSDCFTNIYTVGFRVSYPTRVKSKENNNTFGKGKGKENSNNITKESVNNFSKEKISGQ